MADGKEDARADRARPRHKLFQPAELETAAGQQRVHLLDLSQTGALVNAAQPPADGSFVTLVCGTLRRSARVSWVKGTRFGVTFVLPLTAAQVAEMLALGVSLRARPNGG